MRSLKTSGGLTRGGGIDEKQRAVWSLCAAVAAEYSMTLQGLTNKSFTTSSQYQEVSPEEGKESYGGKDLQPGMKE